jgi:hypothetical protein
MKMQHQLIIRKTILFVLFLFVCHTMFSQDKEPKENAFRFVAGAGPMNLSSYTSTGIAINNSFEFELKKWFLVSANIHLGKSGNNGTDYTYFKYYPDFPENVETNFYETNIESATMNSFSSIGVFALLNPTGNRKTRFIFGPGLCFVSWEEMSTIFYKDFMEYEFYEATNRINNRKKMDLGVRFSLERDIAKKIFVGFNFQGYLGKEEASSLSAIVGFKLF